MKLENQRNGNLSARCRWEKSSVNKKHATREERVERTVTSLRK